MRTTLSGPGRASSIAVATAAETAPVPPMTNARPAPRRVSSAVKPAGSGRFLGTSRIGPSTAPASADAPSASGQFSPVAITTECQPSGIVAHGPRGYAACEILRAVS